MAKEFSTKEATSVEIDDIRIRIKPLGRKRSYSDVVSSWQKQLKLPPEFDIGQLEIHIGGYDKSSLLWRWVVSLFDSKYKRIKAQKIFLDCWQKKNPPQQAQVQAEQKAKIKQTSPQSGWFKKALHYLNFFRLIKEGFKKIKQKKQKRERLHMEKKLNKRFQKFKNKLFFYEGCLIAVRDKEGFKISKKECREHEAVILKIFEQLRSVCEKRLDEMASAQKTEVKNELTGIVGMYETHKESVRKLKEFIAVKQKIRSFKSTFISLIKKHSNNRDSAKKVVEPYRALMRELCFLHGALSDLTQRDSYKEIVDDLVKFVTEKCSAMSALSNDARVIALIGNFELACQEELLSALGVLSKKDFSAADKKKIIEQHSLSINVKGAGCGEELSAFSNDNTFMRTQADLKSHYQNKLALFVKIIDIAEKFSVNVQLNFEARFEFLWGMFNKSEDEFFKYLVDPVKNDLKEAFKKTAANIANKTATFKGLNGENEKQVIENEVLALVEEMNMHYQLLLFIKQKAAFVDGWDEIIDCFEAVTFNITSKSVFWKNKNIINFMESKKALMVGVEPFKFDINKKTISRIVLDFETYYEMSKEHIDLVIQTKSLEQGHAYKEAYRPVFLRAYKQLSFHAHPDKAIQNGIEQEEAVELTQRLNQLKDEALSYFEAPQLSDEPLEELSPEELKKAFEQLEELKEGRKRVSRDFKKMHDEIERLKEDTKNMKEDAKNMKGLIAEISAKLDRQEAIEAEKKTRASFAQINLNPRVLIDQDVISAICGPLSTMMSQCILNDKTQLDPYNPGAIILYPRVSTRFFDPTTKEKPKEKKQNTFCS